MTVRDLARRCGFRILCGDASLAAPVTGCYIGDMLSRVMGRAPAGSVWITIMTNRNVAAVATLAGTACVLLCEDTVPDAGLLDAAREKDIALLSTGLGAYEAARMLPFDKEE